MRADDIKRLSRPYNPAEPQAGRLARALGVDLPGWRRLRDEIFNDLDDQRFGIGWWPPSLGTRRRILIGDYLFVCADSVERNVIEAKLHLLEAMDFWERESDFHARSVTIDPGGQVQVRTPHRECPMEDIQGVMPGLHVVGCVRALASALDCFGAVIVGVAALPVDILRAGFKRARSALGRLEGSSPGTDAQRSLAEQLERAISLVGPAGWLDWLIDLRNMYVHRGRRLQLAELRPVPSGVLDARGQPVIRTDELAWLPRDPMWSDVEAFRALQDRRRPPVRPPVLEEKAEVTLRGALESVVSLVDRGGALLLELWLRRRADPHLLRQPREQWPTVEPPEAAAFEGEPPEAAAFEGYAPGSVRFQPSAMKTHPDLVHRLKAAALSDETRAQWSSFD